MRVLPYKMRVVTYKASVLELGYMCMAARHKTPEEYRPGWQQSRAKTQARKECEQSPLSAEEWSQACKQRGLL